MKYLSRTISMNNGLFTNRCQLTYTKLGITSLETLEENFLGTNGHGEIYYSMSYFMLSKLVTKRDQALKKSSICFSSAYHSYPPMAEIFLSFCPKGLNAVMGGAEGV